MFELIYAAQKDTGFEHALTIFKLLSNGKADSVNSVSDSATSRNFCLVVVNG